jgi:ATP-binding cassette subfamily B protein
MTRNEAPATTSSYALDRPASQAQSETIGAALGRLVPLMADQRWSVMVAFIAILITSGSSLLAPLIIGRTVDTYIRSRDFPGVLRMSAVLLGLYLAGLVATYVQTKTMGTVGRQVLFKLRNALFTKLQQLPLDFFNQNKAGDLISRINNDTDKLN